MIVHIRSSPDPDISALAALVADESRALILQALSDGRALPAAELARSAGVSAQTVSTHLNKLVRGKLLRLQSQGRHRYYSLRDGRVAELLESLALFADPPPALTTTQGRQAKRLRFARMCYRHLAGYAGVSLTRALCSTDILREEESGYEVTADGRRWFEQMGVELKQARAQALARRCLDWSERRPHLAGPLGNALARRLVALRWFVPGREPRVLRLSEAGRRGLEKELSLVLTEP
jgi:DNA-binding transcriptional ArsR family regulator